MPPRTIAISGASSGLGKALLDAYVQAGHCVFAVARRAQQVDELRIAYPSADLRVLDVTDDEGVRHWAQACAAAEVDLVICNAGISPESQASLPPWEVPVASFNETLDVNIKGVANMIRHFTPHLISSRRGTLVALSSGLGRSANPTHGAYCASKWAIEGLLKSVACALPEPLAAVPLAPGVVSTGMQSGAADGDVQDWVKVAAPLILSLNREHSGVSVSVPGFYTAEYLSSWTIPDGKGLPGTGHVGYAAFNM